MKKTIFIFLLLVGSITASAQAFFEKGQSGFSIMAGMQESYFEDGVCGSLEYSFKGQFDVGIGYGSFKYNKSHLEDIMGFTLNTSPKETVILGYAEYWLLRSNPGKDRMINFGLWGEYESEKYSDSKSDYNNDEYEDISGKAFALGFEFTIDFVVKSGWKMQPYFWMGNVWATEDYTINNNQEKESFYGTGAGLGVMLQKVFPKGNSILLVMEMDMDNLESSNDTAFEMSIGFTLPTTNRP